MTKLTERPNSAGLGRLLDQGQATPEEAPPTTAADELSLFPSHAFE